jgi:DNA-directed RNA polymerase subunit M/transcription elongation factor TFIIS
MFVAAFVQETEARRDKFRAAFQRQGRVPAYVAEYLEDAVYDTYLVPTARPEVAGYNSAAEYNSAYLVRLHSRRCWTMYRQRLAHLLWNLCNSPHAKEWRRDFANGASGETGAARETLEWLKDASHAELWPERWPAQRFVVGDHVPAKDELPVSTTIRCGACRKRHVEYIQLQTRSADEGLTTYFHCLTPSCGKRWKQS